MEITLVDGIKDGHKYELVLVDGKETPMYVASRLLTNTDRERGLGIFNGGNTWFEKGDMRAAFEFEYAKFGTPEYVDVVTYQRLKSLACLYAKSREACGRVTLLPD